MGTEWYCPARNQSWCDAFSRARVSHATRASSLWRSRACTACAGDIRIRVICEAWLSGAQVPEDRSPGGPMACLGVHNARLRSCALPQLAFSRRLSWEEHASGASVRAWPVPREAVRLARHRLPGPRQAVADFGTGEVKLGEEPFVQDFASGVTISAYDWEKEWYPMYLEKEMPTDSPLGLTVFDRPLVLFYDGNGVLNCLEDRCPHRAAKLSEGQVIDGRLECLYHGWQFQGDGSCARIPQLLAGGKIPSVACARSYAVQVSQGVIWVWMADRGSADTGKIPWFEHYAREGFRDISTIHELPYDYSILLENLMDPAHIPISHDRTDLSGKRENAQPLLFEVVERSARGFVGKWGESRGGQLVNTTRFEAPCVLRNDKEITGKDGEKTYFSALFLCRPAGQGKSMLIVRFGSTQFGNRLKFIPSWILHKTSNTVFEQDMGFLSSQNETLVRLGVATKDLYLNLKSSDTWVLELRRWMDKVGHGMPYYIGHRTAAAPPSPAVLEYAPAGLVAATASSYPSKGSFGHLYARDPTNRYFRHVIHCKDCRSTLAGFKKYQEWSLFAGVISASVAIVLSNGAWRTSLVGIALLLFTISWTLHKGQDVFTTNFVRKHRV